MKKNILAFAAVAILFAAVGVYVGHRQTAPESPSITAVNDLFAQQMNDAKGQPHSLSQWKGKPVIVNFWATWCAPCVEEMPELSALQNELAPRNIQIIGIGIDSPSNIAEFSNKYKIAYPLYVGGMRASELTRELGNKAGGLPFTVLIGRDGQVKKTFLGRLKMEELRSEIDTL